jgi:hypothetical protein
VYTLGGQDRLGHDAHNALTDLYLDVWDGYRLHYPDIKYRLVSLEPRRKIQSGFAKSLGAA